MALMLRDGDYVTDGQGGLRSVQGAAEFLDRVLWKLTVRRGSFPLMPQLGSRLHLLGRAKPAQRPALARQYVAEALSDEEVTVGEVRLAEGDTRLSVDLEWKGRRLNAELELGGME